MNSVFIVVRLNEDDTVAEIISAHPNMQTAKNAERFYRSTHNKPFGGLLTDIREIDFEA